MNLTELLQAVLLLAGGAFFVIGTLGLLRLPDTLTRLHALTKVDNLGLGLIVIGLLPSAPDLTVGLKLVLIWLLTLAASTTACYLVAHSTYQNQVDTPGDVSAGDREGG